MKEPASITESADTGDMTRATMVAARMQAAVKAGGATAVQPDSRTHSAATPAAASPQKPAKAGPPSTVTSSAAPASTTLEAIRNRKSPRALREAAGPTVAAAVNGRPQRARRQTAA